MHNFEYYTPSRIVRKSCCITAETAQRNPDYWTGSADRWKKRELTMYPLAASYRIRICHW